MEHLGGRMEHNSTPEETRFLLSKTQGTRRDAHKKHRTANGKAEKTDF
jgi:hypothetical protein